MSIFLLLLKFNVFWLHAWYFFICFKWWKKFLNLIQMKILKKAIFSLPRLHNDDYGMHTYYTHTGMRLTIPIWGRQVCMRYFTRSGVHAVLKNSTCQNPHAHLKKDLVQTCSEKGVHTCPLAHIRIFRFETMHFPFMDHFIKFQTFFWNRMHTSDITRALYGRIRALYGKFDVIKMGVVGVHAVIIIIRKLVFGK